MKNILLFREARINDIPEIHEVRMSVTENTLNNPQLVRPENYFQFITDKGKGWVCEAEEKIVGFAIIDLPQKNIWALFVHPAWEAKGIGKSLHDKMLNWYFSKFNLPLWLSTAPGTRAEKFYFNQGWVQTNILSNGEVKFEMTGESWNQKSVKSH